MAIRRPPQPDPPPPVDRRLPPDLAKRMRDIFEKHAAEAARVTGVKPCQHCGGIHNRSCPRVRRMEFQPTSSQLLSVEFWPDGKWSDDNIIWPEDCDVDPPDPDQPAIEQ